MQKQFVVIAVFALVGSLGGAELPVRKVILYKHGIGYFERGGEIPAGESARLDFKAAEMNDVLKSLTINDQTGNSVSGVRYDSSLPLSDKLKEFPFTLRDNSPLVSFLDQLKGAEIEAKIASGATVSGQIIGARVMASEKPQTNVETLSVLTSAGVISNYDLSGVVTLKFANAELQRQLADYLRSLNASRSREQKSVYIDSARDAARKLAVAYTIPMPVWKSSYRLVLDSGAQKKPMLEGWAIIDNTTSEDWTRVDLSVISGRPISFISRLYEPKFMERQVGELEEERALGPVVYKANAAPMPPPGAMNRAGLGGARMEVAAAAPMMAADVSSVQTDTVTREAGELFEYKFGQPVTVKRNESAMLPFVQQAIEARKLLIYTQGNGRENPLNSAELTNSTGKTLDGGPLSVYDGGVYAGEALVNTFKAGDKRLLSYAQDLGTRVVEDSNAPERVLREIRASRGVVTSRFVRNHTRTYKITNVDKKAKTLIIEHPILPDFTLTSAKPSEQTETHYRFEVKLTGEPAQSLTVSAQEVIVEDQYLSSFNDEDFVRVTALAGLSAGAKQFFMELASLRRQIADAENEIKSRTQQIADTGNDVERLRRNLSSLNGVAGQQERVQKYASDLAALDGQITTLRAQVAAETKKRDELRRQLNAKIETANF
jgi:hypothetical protein